MCNKYSNVQRKILLILCRLEYFILTNADVTVNDTLPVKAQTLTQERVVQVIFAGTCGALK